MDLQHLAEDPRFGSREQRTANRGRAARRSLREIFRTKPTQHWVELLHEAGVPASPVNNVGRMIEDEQVVARK